MANPAGVKFVLGILGRGASRVSEVQSVIFDKAKWSAVEAKRWLREHGFKAPNVEKTRGYLRFRQRPKGRYREFATIEAGRNPEILAPLVEGIATGTGFGVAAGVTTPLVVGAVERVIGRRKRGNPIRPFQVPKITKKGNALGFTVDGQTVTGQYSKASKSWQIRVVNVNGVINLADGRNRDFGTYDEAEEHAASIIDPVKTRELAWWSVGRIGLENPISAQSLSEEFHGRPSTDTEEFDQTEEYHDELAGLGDLTEVEVGTKDGKHKVPLDFHGDDIKLASTPDGRQLHFIGGEQHLDDGFLSALGLSKAERKRDTVKLGEAHTISYFTDKHHLVGSNGEGNEYIHEFGEEGGSRPMLVYDRLNERLGLVGGSYEVRGEGVVD